MSYRKTAYHTITNAIGQEFRATDKTLANLHDTRYEAWKVLLEESGGSRQYAWDMTGGYHNLRVREFCFKQLLT